MKKQLINNAVGVISIAAFVLAFGNNSWWLLPRPVEVTALLFVLVGLGYFYVWPQLRDMRTARARVCPHCGKLLAGPVYRDTRDVG